MRQVYLGGLGVILGFALIWTLGGEGLAASTSAAAAPVLSSQVAQQTGSPTYRAQGRRDPFRPLITTRPAPPRPRRGGGPLQQVSATELRLEGIVRSPRGYVALVMGPDGKGYTLRVGTPVGAEGGRVRAITQDQVIIEEPVVDPLGRVQIRKVVLRLHATDEAQE